MIIAMMAMVSTRRMSCSPCESVNRAPTIPPATFPIAAIAPTNQRTSLVAAKGIKISKKINVFGFKNEDLGQFTLANIEVLIKKKLIEKNLIKPIYLS